MAVIRDKNTGEPIAWTADDPIARREGPSPQPYPGEAGSTLIRSSELTAAQNLDQAEMGMTPTQAPDTGTSNTMTIQDDYGNTITYDRDNPNPETSAAYSSSSYGNDPPVSPDPNYQNDAAASDAGNLGTSVSSGISMRDSNTMDATNTYGSAAEVAGAGSDIGNLGSSVNSSLGGITDTGRMFSSATSAASSAASGDLLQTLNSIPGGSLTGVMGAIPGIGNAALAVAKGGSVIALAGVLSKGLSSTGIAGLVNTIGIGNVAKIASGAVGQVGNFLKTGFKIGDAGGHATALANTAAAESGLPTSVTVNGTTVTVPPPARPMDVINAAKGSPMASIPPEARTVADNVRKSMASTGNTSAADETDGPPTRAPGMPDIKLPTAVGAIRDARAVVPSMEAIMFDVPQNALSKFTSLLPATFKSLLPIGAVAGLVSKGPVSLGGLTQLVGGAALGAVAGQALRSVGSGNISAVSGLTGMLGAQALARTVGSGAIPINIASTYGGAMLGAVGGKAIGNVAGNLASNVLGTSPSTTATIANVVGIVGSLALTKNLTGIPVSSQVLGLAANVALKSAGIPTGIPTSVLGTASSFASNPLSSLVGSLVSGRVPIIPTNLSIGNVGALSGLTQNLQSLGLAENIIPRSQMAGLLPGNLQNQVRSSVPPRMTGSPGYRNEVEDRNRAATTQTPAAELQPRTGSAPSVSAPMLSGTVNGQIPYEAKICKHFTLGDVSLKAKAGSHRIVAQNGLSVDQIIAALSWLGVNILDPLKDNYGKWFQVNSGFRGADKNAHGRGAALDLKFGDRKANHEAALWIRQNNLPAGLLILETGAPKDWNWLHVAGGKGHPTGQQWAGIANHSTFTGGEPYHKGPTFLM